MTQRQNRARRKFRVFRARKQHTQVPLLMQHLPTERCTDSVAETNEPEEGRILRICLKQEIKAVHALALADGPTLK